VSRIRPCSRFPARTTGASPWIVAKFIAKLQTSTDMDGFLLRQFGDPAFARFFSPLDV
jgi:hypothetical protein